MVPRSAMRSPVLLPVTLVLLLLLALLRILLLLTLLLPLLLLLRAPPSLLPTFSLLLLLNHRRRQAIPRLDLVAKALPAGLRTVRPGTAACCSRRIVHPSAYIALSLGADLWGGNTAVSICSF